MPALRGDEANELLRSKTGAGNGKKVINSNSGQLTRHGGKW